MVTFSLRERTLCSMAYALSAGALNEGLSETSYNELEIYKELACHRITAFHGKLKGVLHSQDDGANIFPSQLHNMSELRAFDHKHL